MHGPMMLQDMSTWRGGIPICGAGNAKGAVHILQKALALTVHDDAMQVLNGEGCCPLSQGIRYRGTCQPPCASAAERASAAPWPAAGDGSPVDGYPAGSCTVNGCPLGGDPQDGGTHEKAAQ